MRARTLRVLLMSEEVEIEEVARAIEKAHRGDLPKAEYQLVFRGLETLRTILTPERVGLLKRIRREKPGSVYELAKLAGRDRKSVITDLRILKNLGLVTTSKREVDGRPHQVPHVSYSRLEIAVEV